MPWDGSQLLQQHHETELSPTHSTLAQACRNQTDGGTSCYVRFLPLCFFLSFLPSFHLMLPNASRMIFICFKIIVCIVSHWSVGAHHLVHVESPIGWPAGEALTGALGALNPEFNGDLSTILVLIPQKGYSPCSSCRWPSPCVFPCPVACLLFFTRHPACSCFRVPRAPWFHSPLMLAHGSNLTVCSQGPWPLSHRIHWYFSRAPSGQDPHRQTPQGALDRSRSFLASQDFGIPAVFIPRQVLTVRIPRTPLVLKSHGVSLFQIGVPGAIVSGSFVRDPVFSHEIKSTPWTGYSSRVLHGSGATWLPGPARPALPVMITSGPEDQESGQSSESGQWSPGQDSLLVNRIFSWIAKYICPTLHHCCTLLFGSQGAPNR